MKYFISLSNAAELDLWEEALKAHSGPPAPPETLMPPADPIRGLLWTKVDEEAGDNGSKGTSGSKRGSSGAKKVALNVSVSKVIIAEDKKKVQPIETIPFSKCYDWHVVKPDKTQKTKETPKSKGKGKTNGNGKGQGQGSGKFQFAVRRSASSTPATHIFAVGTAQSSELEKLAAMFDRCADAVGMHEEQWRTTHPPVPPLPSSGGRPHEEIPEGTPRVAR